VAVTAAMAGAGSRGRLTGLLRRVSRAPHRRGLLLSVVLLLATALMAVSPAPRSQAVENGLPARSHAAQVRVFENGEYRGGGTLVNRNWVLTTAHLFDHPDNPAASSVRFGVVNDRTDASDRTTLRTIDRVVPHPDLDLALVHFADPVPAGTWIPDLAQEAPPELDRAVVYGWAPEGHTLNRVVTVILNSAALGNIALLRSISSEVAADFSGSSGIPPLVTNDEAEPGDSGSGVFTNGTTSGTNEDRLVGVVYGAYPYSAENRSGTLYGPVEEAGYQFPVWRVRPWVRSVIDGEGPSGSNLKDDEVRSRRPTAQSGGSLPMTMPPQTGVCEPGEKSCTSPGPHWVQAALLGSGNYRGTALARCATVTGNGCSFSGTASAPGASARMPLGPSSAPNAPGTREVMVWCRTGTAFPDAGSPTRQVLRVSLTNADGVEVPVGMGWWDVTPDQVGTGTSQTPVDADQLAAC
jgi:hypothetical protein